MVKTKKVYIDAINSEVEKEAIFMQVPLGNELKNISNITVNSNADEKKAVALAKSKGKVIIKFSNDYIIPLENILSQVSSQQEILVSVENIDDARVALNALEIGADSIILKTADPLDVSRLLHLIKPVSTLKLTEAIVTKKKSLGLGARVCVDTVDIMVEGEGMLIGSSSQGMMLIQAEVAKNEFVNIRPFRVNAGTVALYIQLLGNKTKYLQELEAGSDVLIVNRSGECRTSYVARAKIEQRPLVLIEAKYKNQKIKAILQLAETVRLVKLNGSVSVTDIKLGEKILVNIEIGGRHFGNLVKDEAIIEQ